jgi:hypothetical protein
VVEVSLVVAIPAEIEGEIAESSEVMIGGEAFSVSAIEVDSEVDCSEVIWVSLPAEIVVKESEDVKTLD